ncbi:hypothetical protein PGT21_024266 [Puccinia graminis f. sp. tritici]|uniref:Transmembrane protein n=2 Tax=Puccinia graminis f. sp. tritici TaxID=56615 RepID=H6QRG0_PUCGT|nr:uncharacterized protein PGTG_21446 [Puccinia graminis f. sp. tritici CRL 75-36-700-3]KAA1079833.1 hypothetical protein PGT21_025504 [Puccinia graminis f. sp. tritici]EHS63249.1 hypothetical protein PGTG_21446 [Puccinia graminis f. sp. tritici CRL 75-36-700-3]KAA1083060.1 hypothetical protein PGT21_024266 [Puccinia graminis f. sp. tritici]KAA1100707.1 hypothetical protein PGTUg99_018287 [Puccinia graminis f. sp. tritici]KAA1124004.1 hypothetical protein PGTUg99_018328 [Puccinia graminis f. s
MAKIFVVFLLACFSPGEARVIPSISLAYHPKDTTSRPSPSPSTPYPPPRVDHRYNRGDPKH